MISVGLELRTDISNLHATAAELTPADDAT
jgi:hypothetical protein